MATYIVFSRNDDFLSELGVTQVSICECDVLFSVKLLAAMTQELWQRLHTAEGDQKLEVAHDLWLRSTATGVRRRTRQ